MTTREKEKINTLINEAIVCADRQKDYLTGLDNDCEEISIPCLTIEEVKRLLENLKMKLLRDDEPKVNGLVEESKKSETPKPCPYCGKPPVQTAVHRSMDWDGYKLECTNPRCPEPLHILECPTERIAVYTWNHGPRFNGKGERQC